MKVRLLVAGLLLAGCSSPSVGMPSASTESSQAPSTGATAATGAPSLPAGVDLARVAPWDSTQPRFLRPAAVPGVMGVNYHPMWQGMDAAARARELDLLVAAGVSWVRVDVAWSALQPVSGATYAQPALDKLDSRLAEITTRGMRTLLMLYWAPAWSSGTDARNGRPGDPADYARAAAFLAKRYSGANPQARIDGLEIWNEQNKNLFWQKAPLDTRVSAFAELVEATGKAVDEVDTSLPVVVGGTSSIDTDWFEQFYADPDVVGSYDALAIHPYSSPSDEPPDSRADGPVHAQYYLAHISALDELMAEHGDTAPVWVTEFGWSTHADAPDASNWERGVTADQQADYLLEAFGLLADYPRVAAAFWYDARDSTLGNPHLDGFGLINVDFTTKPAYYAMRCVSTAVCGPPGAVVQTPTAEGLGTTSTVTEPDVGRDQLSSP